MLTVCFAPHPQLEASLLKQRLASKRICVNTPLFLENALSENSLCKNGKSGSSIKFEQVFLMHNAKAFDIIGKVPLLSVLALFIFELETGVVWG
jgi:hypothetical protein